MTLPVVVVEVGDCWMEEVDRFYLRAPRRAFLRRAKEEVDDIGYSVMDDDEGGECYTHYFDEHEIQDDPDGGLGGEYPPYTHDKGECIITVHPESK